MIINNNKIRSYTVKFGLKNTTLLLLILAISLTGLTACGFKLRGAVRMPSQLDVVYIKDSLPPSTIYPMITETLKDKKVIIADNPEEARHKDAEPDKVTAILHLADENFQKRLLSSSKSNQIKEYQLNYSISFSVKSSDGETLLSSQTVRLAREQSFDETQVLAKIEEQEELRHNMIQDAVRQMLRRLQSIK